ncbi:MAG: SRPBCC family protein [Polaromonas sp.]|uniref:SRPBCC family protein n=1 Tax=Polaromonas sp. TaxID=1869339 RepID=UPI0024891ED9|nr:SRPBCC family protein [Polaromonas sp.]MDI1238046.1 SRPBCC family protein [Polaromonas sp.]
MITISHTEEMRCSPEQAFAFAGDYANDPLWRQGVLSMDYENSGAPSVGARTRERMRSLGFAAITVAEVIEYSESRTAFRSLSGPLPCSGSRHFIACPTGTRVTYTLTLDGRGAMRLIEPLLGILLARQVPADLRRLKQQLEQMAKEPTAASEQPACPL